MCFSFGKHLIGHNGGEQKESSEFIQDRRVICLSVICVRACKEARSPCHPFSASVAARVEVRLEEHQRQACMWSWLLERWGASSVSREHEDLSS